MEFKKTVFLFFYKYWEVLFIVFLFTLLLFRNPYSNRNLIANLEPYPDSFHYVNPALSLMHGKGLYITRGESKILPGVPPLYSISLIPAFLINQDVRTLYFTNVAMSFISLWLFYLILQHVFPKQRFLRFFLLFLFVTNYIVYWFPELAMAENLLLPLILADVYFMIKPVSRKYAVLVPIISVLIYACKFASLSLTVSAPILYFGKLLAEKKSSIKMTVLKTFLATSFISIGIYLLFDYFGRGSNLVWGLIQMTLDIFSPKKISVAIAGTEKPHDFFSVQYLTTNAKIYLSWLVGSKIKVLPKQLMILPPYLAIPGLAGLFVSLRTKRKFVATIWLIFIFFTIALMMLFYAADGRYLLVAVPGVIIGVGLFLTWIRESFKEKGNIIYAILLLLFFLIYGVTQASRLKFDIMLNLKYSETPWYYLSVKTFDQYLAEHKSEFKQTPVIISAIPPYFIDLYAKQDFIILPLSPTQEFDSHKKEAWGDHNYDNLPGEYTKYLSEGHPVFLTKYGLGDVVYLHTAYDQLFQKFTLEKVVEGCFTVCDVYRVISIK